MRWRTRIPDSIPTGTRRVFNVFAIFPVSINGESRWLERVEFECVLLVVPHMPRHVRKWFPIRFTDRPEVAAPNGWIAGYVDARPMPPQPVRLTSAPPKRHEAHYE